MRPQDAETARWFAEQVHLHEDSLRNFLRGFVGASEVDDVVQETYGRMLRARERGPIASPRGLLFATARNAATDLFRRRATSRTIAVAEIDLSSVLDPAPTAAESVSRRQELEMLEAAIWALPPRCREILVMRKFENQSYREIARRLGISEHTVAAQLAKAVRRCEEFFATRGGREIK